MPIFRRIVVKTADSRRKGSKLWKFADVLNEWSLILLIRDMVVEGCNRRFGCETIHPTHKFISINVLQMSWVITRSLPFWPQRLWRLLEAKNIISWHVIGVAQAPFFKGDAHGIYLNRNQKFINLILYEAADIVKFLNSPETSFSDARQVLTVQPVMFGIYWRYRFTWNLFSSGPSTDSLISWTKFNLPKRICGSRMRQYTRFSFKHN